VGGDKITGTKMGPCDEMISPGDEITGPKIHLKNKKENKKENKK
jgi:hypothetical protein